MIVKINELQFNVAIKNEEKLHSSLPLILLHGFTGNSEDWSFLNNSLPAHINPIAIDLIGHGKTSVSRNENDYTEEAIVDSINQILKSLKIHESIICGYSMGGRAALSFSLVHPQSVKGLILESTTAGIENESERRERALSDESVAEQISINGTDKFIGEWYSREMFKSLSNIPHEDYIQFIKKRKENNPLGLAYMIKNFSPGLMKNHWPDLEQLKTNVLLISGSLDKKFTNINRKMIQSLPNSEHIVIDNAGHNVHLEKPEEFIILLNRFLRTF